MGVIYDWSPVTNALNGLASYYGQQKIYNNALNSLFGSQAPASMQFQQPNPQIAPPSQIAGPNVAALPGGAPMQGASASVGSPAQPAIAMMPGHGMTGPLGQMPGADITYNMLKNAPPSLGYPLLLQAAEKQQERQQSIADQQVTPLSDAEAVSLGLRPGGLYGRQNATGNIVTIQPSDMHSAGAVAQEEQEKKDLATFQNKLPMNAEQKAAHDAAMISATKPAVSMYGSTTTYVPGKGWVVDNGSLGGAPGPGGGFPSNLSDYSPQDQNMVRSMLDGRQAPPAGRQLMTPQWQRYLQIAQAIDPTFDQTQWTARVGARKDMLGGGKGYQNMQAASTAISHLGRLYDQAKDVSGVQFPLVGNLVNAGVNAAEQASGVPGVPAYNDTLQKLSQEATKLYRGTGGSESDIKEMQANLGPNLSTAQKQAGIANTVHLFYGRIQSQTDAFNKAMHTNFPPGHFLSPQARSTIQKMGFDPDTGDPVQGASSAQANGAHAAPAQTRVINGKTYHQINGQWFQE